METFIKRFIAERTNKVEIRSEEQSEKAKSCRENLWNEILLKGNWFSPSHSKVDHFSPWMRGPTDADVHSVRFHLQGLTERKHKTKQNSSNAQRGGEGEKVSY